MSVSYLCMLASEQGIAAAGDSRLTLMPIPLHLDRSRKVFSAPEQHLVWACCGLTVWFGMNLAHITDRILRRPGPLRPKLEEMVHRLNPILRMCQKTRRKDAVFSLLVGVTEPGQVYLLTLDLLNGTTHRLKRWDAPAMTEAGWRRALRPPMIPSEQLRGRPVEELAELARQRVRWAVERDHELSVKNPAHRQTVGGEVRWVVLRAPRLTS